MCDVRGGVHSTITYGNTARWDDSDDWRWAAHPWTVELRYQRRTMTVPFWTGELAGEPDTAGVLECLLSDASMGEESFTDFCADFGYDEDSRKAYRIWEECSNIGRRLRRLLGSDFDRFQTAE